MLATHSGTGESHGHRAEGRQAASKPTDCAIPFMRPSGKDNIREREQINGCPASGMGKGVAG